jgi:tetratricopeptide (TPR) repeat protein
MYEKSLTIKEEIGDRAGVATSLHQIGRIHETGGDHSTALVIYEKARKILEELGDRANVAISHGAMGRLLANLQCYQEAFEHSLQALLIYLALESPNRTLAIEDLQNLRAKWGKKKFDAAWQQATGEAVPEWLK